MQADCLAQDSVIKEFPPVTVTAGRLAGINSDGFSPITLITKPQINNTGAWQVNEALRFAPGIFIRNYGGLGGLKTVSLRGTSSQQTLFMLDGVRLNSTQNGSLDLSLLPVSFLENIEIIRGGQSAIYGGNAIGGVVNLVTSFDYIRKASASFNYGSFNDVLGSLNVSYPVFNTMLTSSVEYSGSKGDYPIQTEQLGSKKTIKRKNSDFRNLSFTAASKTIFDKAVISSRIILRGSDRGAPGPVLQNYIEDLSSHLFEEDALLIFNSTFVTGDSSLFTLGISGRYNQTVYTGNDFISTKAGDSAAMFFNRELQATSTYSINLSGFLADIKADLSYANLNSEALQPGLGNHVGRSVAGLSANIETPKYTAFSMDFSFHAGTRFDRVSDAGTAFSPIAGIIAKPADLPLTIKMQWSYNFRPPDFNEMYYLNYGTANLKPERANSLDASLQWVPSELLNLSVGGFLILTKDQIISVPKTPVIWSAENKAAVLSRGLEITADGNIIKKLLYLNLSYTLQIATDESNGSLTKGKIIKYVPQELFSGIINLKTTWFNFGTDFQYTGFRYSMPDNTPESLLPSYFIINTFISKEFDIPGVKLKFRFESDNILDKRYSVIDNYPMPGRSFRAGVSAEI